MKLKAITQAALAGSVVLSTGAFAGEPVMEKSPIIAPPTHDHNGCVNPGFSIEGGLTYFEAQGDGVETDATIGWRGALRYQTADGLFFAVRGSYTNPDLDDLFDLNEFEYVSGDLESYYLDFLIGDNFHNSDKFCIDVSAGIRYASLEASGAIWERGASIPDAVQLPFLVGGGGFSGDGIGPVLRLEGKRLLSGPWSLYFDFTQAIIFTDGDSYEVDADGVDVYRDSGDDVTFITEIGGGIEYAFGNGYIRAGGEGQYWAGNADIGVYGFVTSIGWNF